jgi:hypothetical protein
MPICSNFASFFKRFSCSCITILYLTIVKKHRHTHVFINFCDNFELSFMLLAS